MDGARARGLNLAVSDPNADVEADVARFAAQGLERGATRTAVVIADAVALDPGAPADAHRDGCGCSALNLMSPPLAPHREEFGAWLRSYRTALLTEVVAPLPSDVRWAQGGTGWRCEWRRLRSDPEIWPPVVGAWRRLHEVTMWLERECMRRGYYLAVGFGAGDCELCEICDTSELCVEPYSARPSMEAVGVDVGRTREATGWSSAPAPGGIALSGLVLIV